MWPNAATLAVRPARSQALRRLPDPRHTKEEQRHSRRATDEEILEATRHWAKVEGIFAAPEGAACLVAYRKLRATGFFKPEDTVVLFNTGSGLKYLDVLDAWASRAHETGSQQRKRRSPDESAESIGPY